MLRQKQFKTVQFVTLFSSPSFLKFEIKIEKILAWYNNIRQEKKTYAYSIVLTSTMHFLKLSAISKLFNKDTRIGFV